MSARQEFDAPQYAVAASRAADVRPFDLEAAAAVKARSVEVSDVLDELTTCEDVLRSAMQRNDGALIGRIFLAARDWYARELALQAEYGAGHPAARQPTLAQVAAMAVYGWQR